MWVKKMPTIMLISNSLLDLTHMDLSIQRTFWGPLGSFLSKSVVMYPTLLTSVEVAQLDYYWHLFFDLYSYLSLKKNVLLFLSFFGVDLLLASFFWKIGMSRALDPQFRVHFWRRLVPQNLWSWNSRIFGIFAGSVGFLRTETGALFLGTDWFTTRSGG